MRNYHAAQLGPLKIKFITYEVQKLTADIRHADEKAQPRLRNAVEESAKDLRTKWRRNARKTARRHGKWYPSAIGYDMFDGRAEVGPDALHPRGQGGMAFEYGSRNQPPHLDGNRALDDIEPIFLQRVREAAEVEL